MARLVSQLTDGDPIAESEALGSRNSSGTAFARRPSVQTEKFSVFAFITQEPKIHECITIAGSMIHLITL